MAYPTVTVHHKKYPYTSVMSSPYLCDNTGILDCAASIEDIKAYQSNAGVLFFPQGTYLIDTNLTIPAGMPIIGPTSTISISAGVTLTLNCPVGDNSPTFLIADTGSLVINGSFNPGIRCVFSDSNTGLNGVVINKMGVAACPEWWAENTAPGTTDMTDAITAALNSGAAVVSLGADTYLSGALTWPTTGVRLVGQNRTDTVLTSSGASGSWLLTYNDTTKAWRGNGFENLTINIPTTGANGIKLIEARGVTLRDFNLIGTGGGAIGILLDDEASTSPQVGTAWNFIDNYNVIGFSTVGIRLDTQGAAIWANRNHIGYGLVQSCGIGYDIVRGDTNMLIGCNPQDCTTGLKLGADANYNYIIGMEEGCTTSIDFDAASNNNMILGNWTRSTISGTGVANSIQNTDAFKINAIDGDLNFFGGTSGTPVTDNHYISTGSYGTGNTYLAVRDNGGSGGTLTTVLSAIANLASPYVSFPKGLRVTGNGTGNTGSGYIYSHSATPEGAITASAGSLCMVTNGTLFYKTSGTGNTGWFQMTTA